MMCLIGGPTIGSLGGAIIGEIFHMNKHKWQGLGLALAITLALGAQPMAAGAQTNLIKRASNTRLWGFSDTLLATTSASTTPVVVLTSVNAPVSDPNSYSVPGYLGGVNGNLGLNGDTGGAGFGVPVEHLHIFWSADLTKATSTTGFCELFVNGAIYPKSLRRIGVGEDVVAGQLDIANTVTGAQAVQLQCASADTAVLTINQADMLVQEIY